MTLAIDDCAGAFYFDAEAADRATEFFPTFLKHHKGEFAGEPFVLADWQRELIVRPLFGWMRADVGLRRFTKLSAWIPKGNGKSPLGSGIGLYLLFCDREDGAEVYAAATDREQAGIVFEEAKASVEDSEVLFDMAKVWKRVIAVPDTRSKFQVLSADVRTKHGFNVHGLLFDELHAQRTRYLWEVLTRGMVKRRQPLCVIMSTAGDDEESIAFEEYDYAKKVMAATITDTTVLPVIFEADPSEDWTSEATWRHVNPGYGITVKIDKMHAMANEARNEPRKRNDFLRYHLNRWTNQAEAWVAIEEWDACKGDVDEKQLAGVQVAAGLDMAQKIDLASLTLAFRLPLQRGELGQELHVPTDDPTGEPAPDVANEAPATKPLAINFRTVWLSWFWIPEDTMARREKEDRVPYREWAKAGLVTATPGTAIDDEQIYRDIVERIVPRFPLLKQGEIGYDPAFATSLALRLQAAGLNLVEVLQNYKHMNEPAHAFEALVLARRLKHNGHRVLRWCVENCAVRRDNAGRIQPAKPKNQRKRIDGVVAGIMATGRLLVAPPPRGKQSYRVEVLE